MNTKPSPVHIRPLAAADEAAFLAMTLANVDFHHPWVFPPTESAQFKALIERAEDASFKSYLVIETTSEAIVGMVNLSQIFMGAFQNAYMGFFGHSAYSKRGYMRQALEQVLAIAFEQLELHRLEANIQPENEQSIALVRRCGFVKEGFSEKYLQIGGEWKDHERWAIRSDIWQIEGGIG
jgi:[ribosomal protein S5]-alanine N-acetyltransferase